MSPIGPSLRSLAGWTARRAVMWLAWVYMPAERPLRSDLAALRPPVVVGLLREHEPTAAGPPQAVEIALVLDHRLAGRDRTMRSTVPFASMATATATAR